MAKIPSDTTYLFLNSANEVKMKVEWVKPGSKVVYLKPNLQEAPASGRYSIADDADSYLLYADGTLARYRAVASDGSYIELKYAQAVPGKGQVFGINNDYSIGELLSSTKLIVDPSGKKFQEIRTFKDGNYTSYSLKEIPTPKSDRSLLSFTGDLANGVSTLKLSGVKDKPPITMTANGFFNKLVNVDILKLIGNDGSTLIGNDGSTLVGNDGASLIGNDGGTLAVLSSAALIGLDGATLLAKSAAPLFNVTGGPASILSNAFTLNNGAFLAKAGSVALNPAALDAVNLAANISSVARGYKVLSTDSFTAPAKTDGDFLDVRGQIRIPTGFEPSNPSYPTKSIVFNGGNGDDTLAIDLATSGGKGPTGVIGTTFNGGAGSGDLLIMDWSAAVNDITYVAGGGYQSFWYTDTSNGASVPMFYKVRFTGVERFDLTSGRGNDTLYGAGGSDRIKVTAGRDTVDLGAGNDTLVLDWSGYGYGVYEGILSGSLAKGYAGNFNTSYGSTNRVDFTGAENFDLTLTDRGDFITTGDGNDTVRANGGDDIIVTFKGVDTVLGGDGTDTWAADKSAATTDMKIDLTAASSTYRIGALEGTVSKVEVLGLGDTPAFAATRRFLTGSGDDRVITRSIDANDWIGTGSGNDLVKVAGGRDDVDLGAGEDTLVVDWSGYGYGVYAGEVSGSLKRGYAGNFNTSYGSTYRVDFKGVEHFDLRLTDRDDNVKTGDGNDIVRAKDGNDTINTRGGIDDVDGGAGIGDRWIADKSFLKVGQDMRLDLTNSRVQATYLDKGKVAGFEAVELATGAGNDVIDTTGYDYADYLVTGAGRDIVKVAGGRDSVDLGRDNDLLVLDWSGYGYGVYEGILSGSLATGYAGNFNTSYGSTNRVDFKGVERFDLRLTDRDDSIKTGDGDDVIRGNGGNDTLSTGRGIDFVSGGDGTADRWIADKGFMGPTQAMVLDLTKSGTQASYLGSGRVSGIEALSLATGMGNDSITTLSYDYTDVIQTGGGSDTVKVAGGRDDVDLGPGFDTLILDWSGYGYAAYGGVASGSASTGHAGDFNTSYGSTNRVDFKGVDRFDLTLTGRGDNVTTGGGADVIRGGDGGDTLAGGGGGDQIEGGAGGDVFVYRAASDSSLTPSGRDFILDFKQGEDRIDLSAIDPNGDAPGDGFAFLARNGAPFTANKLGEVSFFREDRTGTAFDKTIIQVDMGGNGKADFQIALKGLFTLTANDFLL